MMWQAEAEAYARVNAPREACGLVVIVKGRERFWPCRNEAVGDDHFVLCPQDYAAAEDEGEIVCVWHSHCNAGPEPSEADLVSCEATGLRWHIFALPSGRWHTFTPSGYKAPLIGRQFSHGVLDCFALARDWYSQERCIFIPDFERSDDWWHRGENLYLDNYAKVGFVVADRPQHGDVLLMQIASPVPNHAAIWLEGDMILHHIHGRLSSRDVYGEYYRKNTVKVLRYAA
jgi:proteasome lid subunit RPN8/RPN11